MKAGAHMQTGPTARIGRWLRAGFLLLLWSLALPCAAQSGLSSQTLPLGE